MNARFGSRVVLALMLIVASAALPALAAGQQNKVSRGLQAYLADAEKSEATPHAIWVRFSDKALSDAGRKQALSEARDFLTDEAVERRARRNPLGPVVTEADIPVAPEYVQAIRSTGATLRHESRWLNAVSCEASRAQLELIAELPFVFELELVGRGSRERKRPTEAVAAQSGEKALVGGTTFTENEYGASLPALEQIGVPAVHARGLSGRGVLIGVFDTGFNLDHESLLHLSDVQSWDFVDNDDEVGYQPQNGDHYEQDFYGTAALSAVAGLSRNNLIGVAHGAQFLLAKTEDLRSESIAEEDNWIAALEWAENLGVDVVSSGIGYIGWYDPTDMDGATAYITVAAELASSRGVCIVNAVGEQRGNLDWPGIIPPSDGPSVISVGAVTLDGSITSYSSPGPTADGRIKPDVTALGSGNYLAFDYVEHMYFASYGTNYAVPLVAGVAALMLEQNPYLSPRQIQRALQETASRAVQPDNDYGWGVVDAIGAVDFWAPAISHTPLQHEDGSTAFFDVTATIRSEVGLDPDLLSVVWRVQGERWEISSLSSIGGDEFAGSIPRRGMTTMEYYLTATDLNGYSARYPANAPDAYFSFEVGEDTTAPQLSHVSLGDQIPGQWPPKVIVKASDNAGPVQVSMLFSLFGGDFQGPFPLTQVGDHFELDFPYEGIVQPGMFFSYLLTVQDEAPMPHLVFDGPHAFDIVANKGRILVVDDRRNSQAALASERARASATPASAGTDKTTDVVSTWLTDSGYDVDVILANTVGSSSFLDYDAVMVTCGRNFTPFAYVELRRTMVAWVEAGGHLLVEGGETGYSVYEQPGYPELADSVLPAESYAGEDGSALRVPEPYVDHPLVNRPHILPSPLTVDNDDGFDYGAADMVMVDPDAAAIMQVAYGSRLGGMVAYDNNSGPDSGQIVYLPFDVTKTEASAGQPLLDNIFTYFLFPEPAGEASISGRVRLYGRSDYSGATVSIDADHSATTDAEGRYTLDGLWSGTYKVTVEVDGYPSSSRQVVIPDTDILEGANFYLSPVVETSLQQQADLAIPDNDPAGIESVIEVTDAGVLQGLTIDCDLNHFAIGHLTVRLTSPGGTTVTLHNKSGGTIDDLIGNWPNTLFVDGPGSLDDFVGENTAGPWTLEVTDTTFGASGTLNSWTLNLLVAPTDVAGAGDSTPLATRLVGNFPNPFNPRTVIRFELAKTQRARIEIFDLRGRLVRTLADDVLAAGPQEVTWDGKDSGGREPASGIYFCRLSAGKEIQVGKMTLVR